MLTNLYCIASQDRDNKSSKCTNTILLASRTVVRLLCFDCVFVFVLVFVPLEDFCRSTGVLSLSCEAIPYIFVFDLFIG
jgi:hypothetical protein